MNTQTQDDIIKLDFPDSVRTRPGMYIGSCENPNVLLREIIDNSIDECYKCDYCDTILIDCNKDAGLIVDNGRGIPIKAALDNPKLTMAYESAFELHAGSKFNKSQAEIGQNGVGSSCVVALSKYHVLAVRADKAKVSESTDKVKNMFAKGSWSKDFYYILISERGILKNEKLVNKSDLQKYIRNYKLDMSVNFGTLVYFEPDDTIFDSCHMRLPDTLQYFKYIADRIYNKEVEIIVNGEEYKHSFEPYEMEFMAEVESDEDDAKNKLVKFLVSCRFNEDFDISESSGSINGLVVNQGHHLNYCQCAFRSAYDYMFPGIEYDRKQMKGIDLSVICMCPEPVFNSQTKERCTDIPGLTWNSEVIKHEFIKLIKKNYEKFLLHNKKLIEFINMNRDLGRMEILKSEIPVIGLDGERRVNAITPTNVKTCSSRDREECELFIVEGKSAAGSIIKARDTRTQAVLPLRGKPLNSAGMDIMDIIENEEMKDLVATIGTGVDERFSLDALQYGKIVLCSDADPDGANIASLVLGLFFSHMKYLINAGMVYICDSPLFKQGDKYFYPGEENKLDKSKPIQRYKGLGELNPSDVKYAITNPKTRRLVKIKGDAESMAEALRLITSTFARKELMIDSGYVDEDKMLIAEEVI